MVILDFHKLLLKLKIRRKPLSLVLMELMLIGVCLLVYAMLLLLFKDASLLFFMAFVKRLLRYSWMIFLSMGILLIIVCETLIKFCRDVKKLTLFLIGRNATLWSMKELYWDIKFLREVLKLIELKLKRLRRCPIRGMLKVFVVFLVMLGFIGDLLKIYLKFQSPLVIFFKKMYLLFLMMIVRKLLKL